MKLELKEFQQEAVDKLYAHARSARREAEEGTANALVLASPTGSGKTVIATALMERILDGGGEHPPDDNAVFLWLTDAPDLNEQSRRKIVAASSIFSAGDIVMVDTDFDAEVLEPGRLYFLNTQKLGTGTLLTKPGDRRFTFWETVTNTVRESPGNFWLILDEAHKGMLEGAAAQEAATIAQKFVRGSNEIPPVPLILGISATPERFVEVLRGTERTRREVTVPPEDVRASGLLKESIVLYHPTDREPSDWSLLRAASEKLLRYAGEWESYCLREEEPLVKPILVVQVEDADDDHVTRTSLDEALAVIEGVLGELGDEQVGHAFQEGHALEVGERKLRYVPPADIQDDEQLRVVFFKLSLNTGWDCPRAEVIMSFRRAIDYTRIAQLVGRLVRTPLARAIAANDFLNGVSLYLPHYDRSALNTVIDYLSKPETGLAAVPEFVEGNDLLALPRDPKKKAVFELAETLPTYVIERLSKSSNVRRLIRLGRALAYDKLDAEALERYRTQIVDLLEGERKRLARKATFKAALKERAEIDIRGVRIAYGSEGEDYEESYDAVAVIAQNIDDLHAQSGRKLGEGLHTAYVKARVAKGRVKAATAKLELAALLDDAATTRLLEENAGKAFNEAFEQHKAAIRKLTEARRETYRKLRRQAAKPEPEELELPEIYEVAAGDRSYARHLFIDDDGSFSAKFNEWEKAVIDAELSDKTVVGWLRNVPRKNWAFRVPFTYQGEDRPMFPDFLFFRKAGDGIVADILEPHSLSHDDSAAKAKGLADFALAHGDEFGRIELIIREGDKLLRLDVNKDSIRDKVRTVSSNEHLHQLFESAD